MKNDQLNSIFESHTAPDCDIYNQFLHAVNSAARTSGLTRRGLADRMNQALMVHEAVITEGKLNKYLSPATELYLPAHYLPALIWALRSIEPANILLAPLMYSAFDQRAQLLQQHAELELEKKKIQESQTSILETLNLPNE
ncbi:hypothetical protein [Pseudoalteromonas rubra]|uniref:hypothetical protein n=1 Tax=Pseudoalteromonas rubra TaxID=43658 RepID=UPI002DBB7F1D|nr:hypothetical protein [Pseudoalteromonas rubra]MEC4091873.1 hypothetical protein [Pseudoalteromonas rubra]